MKLTIDLTEEEFNFLQKLQGLIISQMRFGQERCTLEDVVHECIRTVIYSGSNLPEGGDEIRNGL